MIHRKLGNSELEVPVITFGAWAIGGWMWGGTDEEQAITAIRRAVELGVNAIDTAAVYGFGRSEEIVAKAVEPYRRDEILIFTKFGLRWDLDEHVEKQWASKNADGKAVTVKHCARADSIVYECEQSLRRLKTDYIDLYQQHWPDPGTPVAESMGALDKLLQQGKIRAAGVSNFNVEMLEEAVNAVDLASLQPPYSMVLRDAEQAELPWCIEHDVGVIAYSPLQRGLLTGKITEDYQFNGDDHRAGDPLFKGENLREVNAFLDEIRPIAEAYDATLAQLVINWTVHRPGVTGALVGARSPRQAEENARALDFTLTDEDTARINEKLEGLKLNR